MSRIALTVIFYIRIHNNLFPNNFFFSNFSEKLFNRKQYVSLIAEMKKAFKYFKLSVSSTFRQTTEAGNLLLQDFVSMSKHLDFMAVDSNHVDNFIKMGVPASKIVTRVSFVGSARILPDPDHKCMSYFEICDLISKQPSKWVKYWDSENQIAVAKCKNGFGQNPNIIVFVNGRNVANEMRKMVRLGLAGVMAYAVNFDDCLGKCGFDEDAFNDFKPIKGVKLHIPKWNQTNFPLLYTIDVAITVAMDEMEQEQNLTSFLIFKE